MVVNIINKNFFFAKSIWLFLGSVKHYWKIVSTIEIEFSSNLGDPFEKFWLIGYHLLITFRHYYYAKQMFLTSLTWLTFSDFCCIAKYWYSDRIKLFVRNVRAIRRKKLFFSIFLLLYFWWRSKIGTKCMNLLYIIFWVDVKISNNQI